jgi:hypothetical protein
MTLLISARMTVEGGSSSAVIDGCAASGRSPHTNVGGASLICLQHMVFRKLPKAKRQPDHVKSESKHTRARTRARVHAHSHIIFAHTSRTHARVTQTRAHAHAHLRSLNGSVRTTVYVTTLLGPSSSSTSANTIVESFSVSARKYRLSHSIRKAAICCGVPPRMSVTASPTSRPAASTTARAFENVARAAMGAAWPAPRSSTERSCRLRSISSVSAAQLGGARPIRSIRSLRFCLS